MLTDMAGGVILESDGKTITLKPEAASASASDTHCIVRTDHPMVPRHDNIYYFEVVIEKGGGDSREFGIGFCEENMQLDAMLGWEKGSWGYHYDNGNRYSQKVYGDPYGPTFGEGGTIGCGVNFTENSAFYTKDGKIIGRAFTGVRGKLFPAISVALNKGECKMSLKVAREGDEETASFMFKGSYTDPRTLQDSEGSRDNTT